MRGFTKQIDIAFMLINCAIAAYCIVTNRFEAAIISTFLMFVFIFINHCEKEDQEK